MVNHKESLRLKSLGLTHREIADSAGCSRNTVTRTLARTREQKLSSCRSRKLPSGYFQPSKRILSTRCQTMSGYTGRCRRAASP